MSVDVVYVTKYPVTKYPVTKCPVMKSPMVKGPRDETPNDKMSGDKMFVRQDVRITNCPAARCFSWVKCCIFRLSLNITPLL